jgi:hypothetical protein
MSYFNIFVIANFSPVNSESEKVSHIGTLGKVRENPWTIIKSNTPRSPVKVLEPWSIVKPMTPRSTVKLMEPRSPVELKEHKSPVKPRTPRSPIKSRTLSSPTKPKTPQSSVKSKTPKSPVKPKEPQFPIKSKSHSKFKINCKSRYNYFILVKLRNPLHLKTPIIDKSKFEAYYSTCKQ